MTDPINERGRDTDQELIEAWKDARAAKIEFGTTDELLEWWREQQLINRHLIRASQAQAPKPAPYYNATAPRAPGENQEGQSTATPEDFFGVLDQEFHFVYDLAASPENTKCQRYLTETDDSLTQDWLGLLGPDSWGYLNPPYRNLRPWFEKCRQEANRGAHVAVLVPASVGSGWFREFVQGRAEVRFLNPRLQFVGHRTPYPKDLMVVVYHGLMGPVGWHPARMGRECMWQWQWRLDGG